MNLKYILHSLYSVLKIYLKSIIMILSIYSSLKMFIDLFRKFVSINEGTIIYNFFNLSILSIIQNASISFILYFTILNIYGALSYLLPKYTKLKETYLIFLFKKYQFTVIVISILFFFITTFNDIQLGIIASSLSIYALIINIKK